MDDLGFNKLAGAVLMTALAFVGIRALADAVVPEHEFEAIYVPDVVIASDEPVDEGPVITVNSPEFIAAMDATRGARVFKKCQSCHNAEPGGANGTGPALHGVMGRQMGANAGFGYSSAMASKAAPWTWEEMNGFLTKPKEWLPGTNMNYIGLKNWEDRAAVMAYLNAPEHTNNPLPMPEAIIPEVEEIEVVEGEVVEGEIVETEMVEGEDGEMIAVETPVVEAPVVEVPVVEEDGPMTEREILEMLDKPDAQ
jgi:cytochrome c